MSATSYGIYLNILRITHKNLVTIVPAESGALVRAYASAPDFGFIHLQTVTQSFNNDWVQESKRSTLLKGSIEMLERLITEKGSKGTLAGSIAIFECLEDAIPHGYQARLNKTLSLEESIEPFLKQAGKDGPILTKDGKRILRFTDYDPSGAKPDVLISHDPFKQA